MSTLQGPGVPFQGRRLGAGEYTDAQARFFPAWWTYIGTAEGSSPLYRVVVTNQADLELAKAVEPEEVDADYVLVETVAAAPARKQPTGT